MKRTFKHKAGACLLAALLACMVCASPAMAMEGGEAGITPDPPDIIQADPGPSDPVVPDPPPPAVSDPVVDPPASSDPQEPSNPSSQPDDPPGVVSSRPSSTTSSRPSYNSSRVVYSDPDPRESYVEYIPPSNKNNNNQNNHTTTAQNPVAVAPTENNTELLSSQNWEELLNISSLSDPNDVSQAASELPPINGIFSNEEDAHAISYMLIIGIALLVLGAGGVAFFIYSQFVYKRRKARQLAEEEDDFYDDDDNNYPPENGGSGSTTEPLPYVPTDRDISSFSDPQMRPQNPLKQPPPPERKRVEVEDIDWDQFFKDNSNK